MRNGKGLNKRSLLTPVFLFQLFLLLPFLLQGQPRDSPSVDTVRKELYRKVAKEVDRWEDSVQAAHIKQNVIKNGKPLDQFLQEMKEKEKAEKRQHYFRIGLGAVFLLALLIIGLVRRRKRQA